MGIDYSLQLCFGFEILKSVALAPFLKSEVKVSEGKFHMEDRFDPKTGKPVEPEKVWDVLPIKNINTWYEIDDYKIGPYNTSELIGCLEQRYDCHIDHAGDFIGRDAQTFLYYVNKRVCYKDASDYNDFTIYNKSISLSELIELSPKVLVLKQNLELDGLNPGEPSCFISVKIS